MKYLNMFFPIVHKVYSNLEFYALAVEEQRWKKENYISYDACFIFFCV